MFSLKIRIYEYKHSNFIFEISRYFVKCVFFREALYQTVPTHPPTSTHLPSLPPTSPHYHPPPPTQKMFLTHPLSPNTKQCSTHSHLPLPTQDNVPYTNNQPYSPKRMPHSPYPPKITHTVSK